MSMRAAFTICCLVGILTGCGGGDPKTSITVGTETVSSVTTDVGNAGSVATEPHVSEPPSGVALDVCESHRAALLIALDTFLNDGLDPKPGSSPTPEVLRTYLDDLTLTSQTLVDDGVGALAAAAGTAAAAASSFADFLDETGDIRVYTDSIGDTDIDDEVNAIIDGIDFDGIERAGCDGSMPPDTSMPGS